MALQKFKVHNVKSVWKNYLGDLLFCPVCLKYFHSRESVLNHIRYRSEVCRHNLVMRDIQWTEQQIQDFDSSDVSAHKEAQATGKRRHHAGAPVLQLAGPLQPILLIGRQSVHRPLGAGHRNIGS